MKRLLKLALLAIASMSVSIQTAEAAKWEFHPNEEYYSEQWGQYNGNGWLTVWGTVDGERYGLPLFSRGYVVYCHTYQGALPHWCNDFETKFEWDYGCGNIDYHITYVSYYDGGWKLRALRDWMDTYLISEVVVPDLGDPTGNIQTVYTAVNLEQWRNDPRAIQDTYDINNGVCPNLPGFLIGTTEFTFDPCAPPGGNPYSTANLLTGTLYSVGEITYGASTEGVPTVTQWGLIIMALVLVTAGAVVIVRKKHALA
ncbi:MAG: hypothetical protein JW947_05780 [Sedimentisphaerales bacterium]|nr:hypothetical protein [Sedimentisphaerales bacterium]